MIDRIVVCVRVLIIIFFLSTENRVEVFLEPEFLRNMNSAVQLFLEQVHDTWIRNGFVVNRSQQTKSVSNVVYFTSVTKFQYQILKCSILL